MGVKGATAIATRRLSGIVDLKAHRTIFSNVLNETLIHTYKYQCNFEIWISPTGIFETNHKYVNPVRVFNQFKNVREEQFKRKMKFHGEMGIVDSLSEIWFAIPSQSVQFKSNLLGVHLEFNFKSLPQLVFIAKLLVICYFISFSLVL